MNASHLNETSFKSCCVYVQYKKMTGLCKAPDGANTATLGIKILEISKQLQVVQTVGATFNTNAHVYRFFKVKKSYI